jgi:fructose-1,6-bisphosphatase II / sedoheptulose-1,7-bisphosphatase
MNDLANSTGNEPAAAIDRVLVMELVRVTEAAAMAAARLVGRGDETAADDAAVKAMRAAFDLMPVDGTVVIGEGERDRAPMLYIGEKLGAAIGTGPAIDIAVDPLEGTTITAKAGTNALAVLAIAGKGCLLNAPDIYMEKIAVGPGLPDGVVSLAKSAEENIAAVAEAKGVAPAELMVCVLDRPRHADLIGKLRAIGCGIQLLGDGDIAGVMATADPDCTIDLYMGSGGAPEGVLAAAALRCVGGQFEGRLMFRNDEERRRAHECGITDLDRIYQLEDLARGDCIFAATGVTDGSLLDGVRHSRRKDGTALLTTHSVVMRASTGTVRWIKAEHRA